MDDDGAWVHSNSHDVDREKQVYAACQGITYGWTTMVPGGIATLVRQTFNDLDGFVEGERSAYHIYASCNRARPSIPLSKTVKDLSTTKTCCG